MPDTDPIAARIENLHRRLREFREVVDRRLRQLELRLNDLQKKLEAMPRHRRTREMLEELREIEGLTQELREVIPDANPDPNL